MSIRVGNSAPLGVLEREAFAVVRDVRRRVLFDPTAQLSGGISGGGTCAFDFFSSVDN